LPAGTTETLIAPKSKEIVSQFNKIH